MILSAQTIRKIRPVEPFIEATKIHGMTAGLSHCGYDIRIKQDVDLAPGKFSLASSIERFTMPLNVMGVVHDKSTWARQGLSAFATVIEAGWEGHLTIELVNHGQSLLRIRAGDPIAQIVFHLIDEMVDGYRGKYQNQADEPVQAILECSQ